MISKHLHSLHQLQGYKIQLQNSNYIGKEINKIIIYNIVKWKNYQYSLCCLIFTNK